MSRSGYSDGLDNWELIRWRGYVASAMRGKRGQKFLRELLAALDAMPEKKLIAHELEEKGEVCALGAVCRAKGIDPTTLEPTEHEAIGAALDISPKLVQEVEYINDDWGDDAELRWRKVRKWVAENIREAAP